MKVKYLNMILDKNNNILKILFGGIVGIILIYYSIQDFNFYKFKKIISEVNLKLIFLSAAFLVFSVYIRALRWKILLSSECSTNFLYKSQLIGYFGNNLLPLRLGELLRTYVVGENYNMSKSRVFGSIVLERILDMFITGIFILFILFFNSNFLYDINIILFYGLFFIVGIGTIGIILAYKKIEFSSKNSNKILLIIHDIYKGFANLNSSNIIYISIFTIIIWTIYLLQVYLMQYAFSLNLSINQTLILLVISTAAISIPALPGNFGTFEGSVVYSLSLFNIIDNFGFAFILHFISFIPYTLLGLFYTLENFNLIKSKKLKF